MARPRRKMILAVGCGANPQGDVNIDAFIKDKKRCNPKQITNFVLADVQHLRARFEEVMQLADQKEL